jgi:arginyl-tRNA synthetase
MLSFDGNTAPYLQYAYARIQSIFRRGGVDPEALEGDIRLPDPHERKLAVELLRFSEVVEQVAEDVHPHHLCAYLFELAAVFMRFYEACPILTGDASSRPGRLALCRRTAQTLKTGLGLLGIDTVERM